jgi:hypothetical protein
MYINTMPPKPDPPSVRFVSSFDEIDKVCFEIAKSHLKSSFNLEKSVGFKKFDNKK